MHIWQDWAPRGIQPHCMTMRQIVTLALRNHKGAATLPFFRGERDRAAMSRRRATARRSAADRRVVAQLHQLSASMRRVVEGIISESVRLGAGASIHPTSLARS